LKKEIKKQGSRTITGVKGQFFAFEKTQPGYYGELGLLIINQTLYDLFPFSSFDTSLIVPLSPAEFVQLVLVPEVAVRLIMQDLHLDRDKAIITLRESSQYGVGMFPD
ncbi:restriction of telomere capping protein 4, partial [Suillus spraguei]